MMTPFCEICAYYKLGFRKILDFTSPSCRKELNYFIIIYGALSLLFLIIDTILVFLLTIIFKNHIGVIQSLNNYVFILFNIINIIPLFTIFKRRLNDIVPNMATPLFMLILFMYFIYISLPIAAGHETDIAFALIKMLSFIPYIAFSLVCEITLIAVIIILMSKKGNLNFAPLDDIPSDSD